MKKILDVSAYQGHINWEQVSKEYDTVILRLGIGDNVSSQDDIRLNEYINGCNQYGIKYGFYLVCYAQRLTGEESVESEIAHTERLLTGKNPFAIFYDVEVDGLIHLGKDTITNFCDVYCKHFKDKGYNVGVYANKNWFTNYIDYQALKNKGYLIWLAHYGVNQPSLECDIWQYSDKGNINGINTNTTDMNYLYNESILNGTTPEPKPVEEGTTGVITYQAYSTKWHKEVKGKSDYAGVFGKAIKCFRCKPTYGDITYEAHTLNGKWLGAVNSNNYSDDSENSYAGIYQKSIDGIRIKSSQGWVKYRVHILGGDWLPWAEGFGDSGDEFAGTYGKEIDAIQMY